MREKTVLAIASLLLLLLPTGAALLPDGYRQVEYIEVADSRQYVDTEYKPNSATDVELRCYVPDFSKQNSIFWVRTRNGSYPTVGLVLLANDQRKVRAYRFDGGLSDTELPLPDDLDKDIVYATSRNVFTINGVERHFGAELVSSLNLSIFLFALNDAGSPWNGIVTAGTRLYYFRVKEDGVLVRNFVPCTHGDEVGLYETCQGKFYGNSDAANSGQFTAGDEIADTKAVLAVNGSARRVSTPSLAYGMHYLDPGVETVMTMDEREATNMMFCEEARLTGWELRESCDGGKTFSVVARSDAANISRCAFVPEAGCRYEFDWRWYVSYGESVLPEGYARLNFAKFDNAAINTKYVPALDDTITIAMRMAAPPDGKHYSPFCSRNPADASIPKDVVFIVANGDGKTWNTRLDYGTGTDTSDSKVRFGCDVALSLQGGVLYEDGVSLLSMTPSSAESGGPLSIGASYGKLNVQTAEIDGVSNGLKGRVYAVKVWGKNGQLKLNLLPCRNSSDYRIGFYDTVGGEFIPCCSGNCTDPVWDRCAQLVVTGDPADLGDVQPAYGRYILEDPEAALAASADESVWKDDEWGFSSRAIGWTLCITNADGTAETRTNDEATKSCCTFVPQPGKKYYLTWKHNVRYSSSRQSKHLPARYLEVEWIQGDRQSYVDTDYVPQPNHERIECDFVLTSTTGCQALFCARTCQEDAISKSCAAFWLNGAIVPQYNGVQGAAAFADVDYVNRRHTLVYERNAISLDGEAPVEIADLDESFVRAANPLTFFASYRDSQGNGLTNQGEFKLYSFKVFDLDVSSVRPARCFYPCIDKPTRRQGLYDTVTGRFYPVVGNVNLPVGEPVLGKRGLVIFFG